jgi:hypothetical protein
MGTYTARNSWIGIVSLRAKKPIIWNSLIHIPTSNWLIACWNSVGSRGALSPIDQVRLIIARLGLIRSGSLS